MTSSSFEIRLETDGDAPALSQLSAEAFGPGRFTRSAYRVREGVPPVKSLCLCGLLDRKLVGGIRFTAIRIGETEGAALLGPLVVDPAVKGQGYGKALVEEGLARARGEGFCAGAAHRRHALLRPVRLSTGAAGADHLAGPGRSRRDCLPSSLFPARWPGPRALVKGYAR